MKSEITQNCMKSENTQNCMKSENTQNYMIFILHDDKLLISDILFNNNVKYYKIPYYAFYEINIISLDIVNSFYKTTIKRIESKIKYEEKSIKRTKLLSLEIHDQVNDIMSRLDLDTDLLIVNKHIFGFFKSFYQNALFIEKDKLEKMSDLLSQKFGNKCVYIIDIMGDLTDYNFLGQFKKYRLISNYYNLKMILEGFFLSSTSINLIENKLRNNMNMKSIMDMIFSIVEIACDPNESSIGFYKGLYDKVYYNYEKIKHCIDIVIKRSSERGFVKTIFNAIFILQKINNEKVKFFTTKREGNKIVICTEEKSNFYLIDNTGKYKVVYIERIQEIECFEGKNYLISDGCKGYDIL